MESLLNQEETPHLDQQPLAVGYYLSTAKCGPLPRWLRGECSSEANFHTFKVKFFLHNVKVHN
jgi:mediator of RNA polymerase II transcription subunit 13